MTKQEKQPKCKLGRRPLSYDYLKDERSRLLKLRRQARNKRFRKSKTGKESDSLPAFTTFTDTDDPDVEQQNLLSNIADLKLQRDQLTSECSQLSQISKNKSPRISNDALLVLMSENNSNRLDFPEEVERPNLLSGKSPINDLPDSFYIFLY